MGPLSFNSLLSSLLHTNLGSWSITITYRILYRISLQVVFVDGVTRLDCMRKSDEVKVCRPLPFKRKF